MYIIIAVIWILVSVMFFLMGRPLVGIPWLLVGIINLLKAVKKQKSKGKKPSNSDSDNTLKSIELASDSHLIRDDYSEYEYQVNCSFKAAKSHVAECELLCTYAPHEENGREGVIPCIAVVDDEEIYCAVDDYIKNGTFEGAIDLCPLSGKFLFKAKKEYFGDMVYFYGFRAEEEEYITQAGFCMVYQMGYQNTGDEKKLMAVLDEAAESFHKR